MLTELHFNQESADGWIRRSVTISRAEKKDVTLWLEVPERYAEWLTADEDPLLRLATFHIMETEGECRIHADIDRSLLENLAEHMRIWQLWCPGAYFCPTLTPDAIIDREPTSRNRGEAICAYSGGVDAAYALTSHHAGHWGALSLKVPAALIIHGADIPLADQQGFDYAFAHAEDSLKDFGIELIPVRTNYREFPNNWNDCHLSVITAALSLFGARFCRGILGSDDIASKEMIEGLIPYGMNYVTDRCFDSAAFSIQTVGTNATRTQRCAFISRFPRVMQNLRICWMADAGGRNCGICEKCMRTALNFMSAGYKGELPFDQPFTMESLRQMQIKNFFNFDYVTDILAIDRQTQALPDEVRTILKAKHDKARATCGTPHSQQEGDPSHLKLLIDRSRYRLLVKLSSDKRKEKYQRKLDIVRNQLRLLQEGEQ